MKWNESGNRRRLWIEEGEFDTFTAEKLRDANLYPTIENPAVNIERFIERHLKAEFDQHAYLGEGYAGAIKFFPEGLKIFINRSLTEAAEAVDCQPGDLGRWRATMAHEAMHGLVHRPLFVTNSSQCLLFDTPETTEDTEYSIQCLQSQVESMPYTETRLDWREFQANRGMAALLMPRELFVELARQEIWNITRSRLVPQPDTPDYARLIKRLSLLCEVSKQAATYRLQALQPDLNIGPSLFTASRI